MKRCSAIISHEENANQNQNELPLHTSGMAIEKKNQKPQLKITSVQEDVEKMEPYTLLVRIYMVNWCGCLGKPSGSSAKG